MVNKNVRGIGELEKKLKRLPSMVKQAAVDSLNDGALKIDATIKDSLSTPSQGKVYGNHTASKPGEPPNTNLNDLIKSVFVEEAKKSKMVATVGAEVDYAKDLENGTVNMEARPFMQPAFDKHKNSVKKELRKIVKKGLKK